ncbi:MAG: hypothetical protein J6B43_10630 [Lachnospiraceae bacterium]|nr:hypothetical protein [Lachnospiraceae bacterium]
MKLRKRYNVVIWILLFGLSVSSFTLAVTASESNYDYEAVINQYYELVNNGKQYEIPSLYGTGLNNFVADFFDDDKNQETHSGIYNVKNVQILTVQRISDIPFVFDDEFVTYTETENFFVKCNMEVYTSDKYYMQGNNYFLFTVGIDPNGQVKIINIEIPSFHTIKCYDLQTDDILLYEQTRNYFLYGDIPTPTSDTPVYIDYVRNPRQIRVLYNGSVKSVSFSDYCLTVAANEMNTLKNTDGQRAAAMAIKMFAMHFVNSAASGSNYDINSTVQVYKEGVQISAGAQSAMNYVMDYFLLDYYGANFKTFYRTKESDNEYCKQYGGMLAQIEADTMGGNGKSWQEILRYYYTRVSTVTYYNSKMNTGALIIASQHTHDWGGGEICNYCGAVAK